MSQYPSTDTAAKWSSLSVAAPGPVQLKQELTSPYNGTGARPGDPAGWQGLGLPTWTDSRMLNYHQQQPPSLPPVSSLHSVPNHQHYLTQGGGHFRSPQPPDPSTSQSAFAAVGGAPMGHPGHPHHLPPNARQSALSAQLHQGAPFGNQHYQGQQAAMFRAMQQARQFGHQTLPTVPAISPNNRPASVDQIQSGMNGGHQRSYLATSGGMMLSPTHRYNQPHVGGPPPGSILHPGAYIAPKDNNGHQHSPGLLSIQTTSDSRLRNPAISDISPPATISSSTTSNYDTQTSTSVSDSTRTAAAALLGMSAGDGRPFSLIPTTMSTVSSQAVHESTHVTVNGSHGDSPRPELSAPNSDTTTDNYSEEPHSPIRVTSPYKLNAHGSNNGSGMTEGCAASESSVVGATSTQQLDARNNMQTKEDNERTNESLEEYNGKESPDGMSKEGREATPAREGNGQDINESTSHPASSIAYSTDDCGELVTAPSKLVMALSEMHEPISPANTPQRCASAAADSSTALIDVVSSTNAPNGEQTTPQPTETNLRAAARLEEKIHLEAIRGKPSDADVNYQPPLKMPFRPMPTLASPTLPMPMPRPQMLDHSQISPVKPGPGGVYTCEICNFTNESKFHFNSHMNTHTDHQCDVCDYRARTEGRLKRHMKEFHSEEDRVNAGVGTPEEEMRLRARQAAQAAGLYASQSAPSMVMQQSPHPLAQGNSEPLSLSNSPSALERMQMAFSKQEPMMSPSQTAMDMSSPDLPKTSTSQHSSKPKKYGCKQCPVILYSKDDYWNHQRTHIKPEKLLTCPKCLFVTEYKHHLEYHLRNHFNSKPFKCTKCNYTCVNKSMLNSHMKSHSNFYQYRCADCTYATKYCHSLKLHLRKYGHQAVGGEGVSGSPPETDPYGNRRSSSEGNGTELGPPTMARYQSPYPNPNPTSQPSNLMEMIMQQRKQLQLNAAMANSIATFGVQLPTISNLQQAVQVSQMNAAAAGSNAPQGVALNGLAAAALALEQQQHYQQNSTGAALKCRLCDFQCYGHKELIHHQLSAHAELAKFYGIMQNNALQQQHNAEQSNASGPESMEEQSPATAHARDSPSDGAEGSSGSPVSAEKCSGDEGSAGSASGDHIPNTGSSRRKGKAVKLDQISLRLQGRASPIEEEDNGDDMKPADLMDSQPTTSRPTLMPHRITQEMFRPRASSDTPGEAMRSLMCNTTRPSLPTTTSPSSSFVGECPHCGIAYKDTVMLTIHMGYHSYDAPFRCNKCGVECNEKLRFFMHIAQAPH